MATLGAAPGTVHLVGQNAVPSAEILIRNENPAVPNDQNFGGATVNANGSWDATIYASSGDYISITQLSGNRLSEPLTFQLKL